MPREMWLSNYRPVTRLPLMCKLLTLVLAEMLHQHLELNGLFTDEQKKIMHKSRGSNKEKMLRNRFDTSSQGL